MAICGSFVNFPISLSKNSLLWMFLYIITFLVFLDKTKYSFTGGFQTTYM